MACGDPKALPRLAILDPALTATMPPSVAAATGIDAVAHAIETIACTKRNDTSRELSKQAWNYLNTAFETAIAAALSSSPPTSLSPYSPFLPRPCTQGRGPG